MRRTPTPRRSAQPEPWWLGTLAAASCVLMTRKGSGGLRKERQSFATWATAFRCANLCDERHVALTVPRGRNMDRFVAQCRALGARAALFAAVIVPTVAVAQTPAPLPSDLLNATLWQQRAHEYEATTRSLYRAALDRLRAQISSCSPALLSGCETAAIEQRGITPAQLAALPPAVILDLDETALDNSPFEASLQVSGEDFTEKRWAEWIAASAHEAATAAPRYRLAVPGAAEFTVEAAKLGVTVFYVSNRACASGVPMASCDALKQTKAVMQRQVPAFARAADDSAYHLAVIGQSSDKTSRRQAIALTHRIVMLIGDDLGDFVGSALRDAIRKGSAAAADSDFAQRQWGRGWFMLPNAMYGSWERFLTSEADCPTAAQVPDDADRSKLCRLVKVPVKEAKLVGFAAADNTRLRVGTWNMAWWMSQATFEAWKTACAANPPPAPDPSIAPCDLRESSDATYHTSAQTRDRRARQFRDVISAERPDVLLLQEIRDDDAARELLASLGYSRVWTTFGARSLAQSVGYAVKDGIPVQWPPTALLDLSVPDQSMRGAGKPLRPGAQLLVPFAGKTLAILNVHLKASCRNDAIDQPGGSDPGHCKTLRAQVPVLERWIEDRTAEGSYYILGGDFNRAVSNDLGRLAARLDGTKASEPLTPQTRVGSLLKEISDDEPKGAWLHFPRVPTAIPSSCHKGIDYISLSRSLTQSISGADARGNFHYRFADSQASPQGPSDHCLVMLDLAAKP